MDFSILSMECEVEDCLTIPASSRDCSSADLARRGKNLCNKKTQLLTAFYSS